MEHYKERHDKELNEISEKLLLALTALSTALDEPQSIDYSEWNTSAIHFEDIESAPMPLGSPDLHLSTLFQLRCMLRSTTHFKEDRDDNVPEEKLLNFRYPNYLDTQVFRMHVLHALLHDQVPELVHDIESLRRRDVV